jgi:hypothetical protein
VSVGNRFTMLQNNAMASRSRIEMTDRILCALKMRFQRCLERPGTDYLATRRCIPEEGNPQLPVQYVVTGARHCLYLNMAVKVLMILDTVSLSLELLLPNSMEHMPP